MNRALGVASAMAVVALLVCDSKINDRIKGDNKIEEGDTMNETIAKYKKFLMENSKVSIVRRALASSIIAAYAVTYLLLRRLPDPWLLFVLTFILLIATLSAHTWITTHYMIPNALKLSDFLTIVSERCGQGEDTA